MRYLRFMTMFRAQLGLLLVLLYSTLAADADTLTVGVKDNRFQSATLHVKIGDSVQWVWQDTANPHTTTSGSCTGASCSANPDDNWDSGLSSNSGFTFTKPTAFTTAGTYPYYCKVHASIGMTGSIIVDADVVPATCSETDAVNLDPIPKTVDKETTASIALQTVASGGGLVAPNGGTAAPGDKRHLFVTDTIGKIWAINLTDQSKDLLLDLSALLVTNFGNPIPELPGYDERGLLGLAFHPGYKKNGLLYTFTSEPYVAGSADFVLHNLSGGNTPDHINVVSEWKVEDPKALHPKVSGPRRVLLRAEHPQFNHNGGALHFGRDRMLYIAMGDGGMANDQDAIGGHNPSIGNGQDLASVLGKILRINPLKRSAQNGQYGIPASNPFTTKKSKGGDAACSGGAKTCDEIWAYGFRNPYRFSFDKANGNLFAGDVGQNKIEEIDLVKKGRNYGWAYKEGSFFFLPNGSDGSGAGYVSDSRLCRSDEPNGLTDPLAQYDHDEGLGIVAGFVYRGKAIRSLRARYVFGDYAKAFASSEPENAGRLFYLLEKNPSKSSGTQKTVVEFRLANDAAVGMSIYGFAQDANGELYVLGNTSGVPAPRDSEGHYLETGVVKKIVPPVAD
ncbi:PQQ-dependent sugar dehydrogenase [Methylomonas rhizoryzae]|uniref:PQQ-dependent sugar dehydrogenase n=1 Tax=Methylomonas rhizoryzae TaxID=2608981 RepID=UPI0012327656|nr:PQQ-dependent sugar dehydrogenase [Methylomonas rhizoryzae]